MRVQNRRGPIAGRVRLGAMPGRLPGKTALQRGRLCASETPPGNLYVDKLRRFMGENAISGEVIVYPQPLKTIKECAAAAGVTVRELAFARCFVEIATDQLVVAILRGDLKPDAEKIAKALALGELRMVDFKSADEQARFLERTGYPLVSVPPIGFQARVIMDDKLNDGTVYSGAGAENALLRITRTELIRVHNPVIANIRH